MENTTQSTKKKIILLNVSQEIHRSFKTYCTSKGLTMKDVLSAHINQLLEKEKLQ